ncbi:hypothetical protein DY245_43185 [Streptomyces inhibens]|uniref:Uncharacterized protein n=2 Tax=Streptomyces inhibens TaxID=2293571 RepID=A0A371PPK7_STRIH|nr:hypothetical protein DY245_43185 [Streptomyces inhibens]
MPEPLRRAVHELVSEAVLNCQEVLRYTEPDQAHDWKRMTLIRATDAADTMDMASMLIAAYCQKTGTALDTLASYLQTRQQRSRAAGPQDKDREELAGILSDPVPDQDDQAMSLQFSWGQRHAKRALTPEGDPQKLFTEACLYGLRAKLCDDVDSLDSYLPPQMAVMARRVADVLEEPQPAQA